MHPSHHCTCPKPVAAKMNNLTDIRYLHTHSHKTYMAASTQKLVARTTLCAFMKHKTAFAQVHVQPQPDTTASARYNNRGTP